LTRKLIFGMGSKAKYKRGTLVLGYKSLLSLNDDDYVLGTVIKSRKIKSSTNPNYFEYYIVWDLGIPNWHTEDTVDALARQFHVLAEKRRK